MSGIFVSGLTGSATILKSADVAAGRLLFRGEYFPLMIAIAPSE
jgi:hypothetical protein